MLARGEGYSRGSRTSMLAPVQSEPRVVCGQCSRTSSLIIFTQPGQHATSHPGWPLSSSHPHSVAPGRTLTPGTPGGPRSGSGSCSGTASRILMFRNLLPSYRTPTSRHRQVDLRRRMRRVDNAHPRLIVEIAASCVQIAVECFDQRVEPFRESENDAERRKRRPAFAVRDRLRPPAQRCRERTLAQAGLDPA
jgi:hypothetical protein